MVKIYRTPQSTILATPMGETYLDFTEARDSEWQWHQLVHMQVCTSLQTDNHASTPPLSVLQAGCPSCRPTNSVKALHICINTITRAGQQGPTRTPTAALKRSIKQLLGTYSIAQVKYYNQTRKQDW